MSRLSMQPPVGGGQRCYSLPCPALVSAVRRLRSPSHRSRPRVCPVWHSFSHSCAHTGPGKLRITACTCSLAFSLLGPAAPPSLGTARLPGYSVLSLAALSQVGAGWLWGSLRWLPVSRLPPCTCRSPAFETWLVSSVGFLT